MKRNQDERIFCQAFLQTMDPEQAAEAAGRQDGFALLGRKGIQEQLEYLRSNAAGQLRREDALRRLAQIAFGRAGDVVRLALRPETADPEEMDLSLLSELKVTDKGVEIKLVDRVRALETLCGLLEDTRSGGAEALYQALEAAASEMEAGGGC